MSDIVSPLLQWLNANPEWAGVATFAISAAESVAIIGTIVPGSVTMTAIGALAGAGVIPLGQTIFLAMLGAVLGDGISYWLGHYFKDRLRNMWPFRTNPGVLKSGETFVHRYGIMSIFIGRFVGPVRALVPLVAGMLGMKPLQFTIANIASAIGWAPAYMLPGILLGAASLELPPDIAVHVMLVLLMIFLFIMLCLWVTYKMLQLVHFQTEQLLTSIWHYLKKRRKYAPLTYFLKHHDPKHAYGQLNRAFYLVITASLFLLLVWAVKYNGASNLAANNTLFHFFRGIRNDYVDTIMINITLLGQKEVVLPVVVILFGWLLISKRWRTAAHTLALGVIAAGSVYALKNIIRSPRPWGILESPETYSMPSGHATLSLTLYMGLAFLLALSVQQKRRWLVYSVTFILPLAIGISRLYLGAHWLTDIISAWLLGSTLLLAVIISYQHKSEPPVPAFGIIFITIASLTITFSMFHHFRFDTLKMMYTQENLPPVVITMNEWWEKNNALPGYRTSLFGFPSQKINIEWVGTLDDIHKTLSSEGWKKPPMRDWISTLHRIADIKSTQYLSLISPQYLDQKPALILSRRTNTGKNLLVLRLWNSNRIISETRDTVWVGTVGIVPRSYSWLFKKHPGEITIDQKSLFPIHKNAANWEINPIWVYQPTGGKDMIDQKIILIRPASR